MQVSVPVSGWGGNVEGQALRPVRVPFVDEPELEFLGDGASDDRRGRRQTPPVLPGSRIRLDSTFNVSTTQEASKFDKKFETATILLDVRFDLAQVQTVTQERTRLPGQSGDEFSVIRRADSRESETRSPDPLWSGTTGWSG